MKYICLFNKKYFIYKITDLRNGRVYVGQTGNSEQRYKRYCYMINNLYKIDTFRIRKIHRVIYDAGLENFAFEVIEECDSRPLSLKRENYYITLFKVKPFSL